MPKGEREQFSAKQARKATPTNEKKGRKTVAAEGQFRKGAGKAEGTQIKSTTAPRSGSRPGTRRSSGKKPSGTNLSKGGGTAAKKSGTAASGSRGKRARST